MLVSLVGAVAAVAVFAVLVGVLTTQDSGSFVANAGVAEWDERVTDLVEFVEEERGLSFSYPVAIRFLDEEEYLDEFRENGDESVEGDPSEGDYTDEELEQLHDADVAEYRALGLIEGDLDLDALTDDLSGLGSLAYYSPEDAEVVVRGTDLTVGVRGTLVHELTHALQDQHFDLSRLTSADDDVSIDALVAFRTLVEGDASVVEDRWVGTLSSADADDYFAEQEATAARAEADLTDVPEVLETLFGSPYAIGFGWIEYLVALGDDTFAEVDALLETDLDSLPGTVAALAPWDEPFDIDRDNALAEETKPDEPNDELIAYEDTLGALSLFVLMSAHVPAADALAAAEMWRGDVIRRDVTDGRVCIGLYIISDDSLAMQRLIEPWTEALPPEHSATTVINGDATWVTTCDPGADASVGPELSTYEALTTPVSRLFIAAEALAYGSSEDQAACQGQAVIEELTPEQLNATELTVEVQQQLTEAMLSC